jgi:DNA-binding GntR family transcriptional regulator
MTDPMNLVPRYYQIVSWLNAQIASAAFVPGQRIPTERELGERFGVARETVRRATALLRQEGTLEVRLGKGTYVAASRPTAIRLGLGDVAVVSGSTTVTRASGAVERYRTAAIVEC